VSGQAPTAPRFGDEEALPPLDRLATLVLPLLALLFHLSTAQRYGVFRDELYYVACGEHLDFGYVDHPPFVALVARLAHMLFGTSLLGLRLFPDQLPFARQVQIACDTPKLAVYRITGREAPSHADTEKTIPELRARIETTLGILDAFQPKDFEKSSTQVVSQPRWEGKTMTGGDYFMEHAVPNFFFHVVTAYAILRHNGVELGKSDYLGKLSFR